MSILIEKDKEDILHAVANIYNTMHILNIKNSTCEELYSFKEVSNYYSTYADKLPLQELLFGVMKFIISEEHQEKAIEFVNFSTLDERLKNKKIISIDLIGKVHGWVRCSLIPIDYDESGIIKRVVIATKNINDEKEKEEHLRKMAEIDELTGVYNRHAYEHDSELLSKQPLDKDFTLISVDMNGLKPTNDKFGHAAGDEMIIGVCKCLTEVFEKIGKIYRIGGDEFIITLNINKTELEKKLGQLDGVTANWKGTTVENLTLSKGVATTAEFPDFSITDLEKKADRRMYQDKEKFYKLSGRDRRKFIGNSTLRTDILSRAGIGLMSIEINENDKSKFFADKFIKDMLGIPEDSSPEDAYTYWFSHIHQDYYDSVMDSFEKIVIGNSAETQYPWNHPIEGLKYLRSGGTRDAGYTNGIRIEGYMQNVTNLLHFQKDTLTGLYTKEFFFQRVGEILMNNPDVDYRILVSDIENFKSINEKYGIETADKLLKHLAGAEKKYTPNFIMAARINADKFAVLQYDKPQTREEGYAIQHKILKDAPVQNIRWKHGIYRTSFDRNVSPQVMCDRARLAAESIKGTYEYSCAVYDDNLRKKILLQQQIIENMEDALNKNEFSIYLQPKFNLHSNKTGGAEALIRWIHPELGFMNPGEFIPLFEKNGFVKNVDQFVLKKVCHILRRWIDEKKKIVPISVNLSRRDFEFPDLAEQIVNYVDSFDIPHEYIHFELTESAFSDNPEQISKIIKNLHDRGFMIELDDFGTGYSSLSSLSDIDFDILKLDMSIIKKDDPDSKQSILDICSEIMKMMNLESVAEGVESEEQLERLRTIGCDFIQGYLFSRPLSVEEFEKYIEKN